MPRVTLNTKNITKEDVIINVINKNNKVSENTKNLLRAAFTTVNLSEEQWEGVKKARTCGNFEAVRKEALSFVDTLEKALQTNDLTYIYIKHGGELIHRDDYIEMAKNQIEKNSFRIELKDPETLNIFVMNREELAQKNSQKKSNFGEVKKTLNL